MAFWRASDTSSIQIGERIAGAGRMATAQSTARRCRSRERACERKMRGVSTRNLWGGERVQQRLWNREVGGERELHRGKPRESEAVDGGPLDELRLCVVLIDGTPFKDRQMVVGSALAVTGANGAGRLREGAIENATVVVGALLSDLPARGLDFSTPRLYVLDGA